MIWSSVGTHVNPSAWEKKKFSAFSYNRRDKVANWSDQLPSYQRRWIFAAQVLTAVWVCEAKGFKVSISTHYTQYIACGISALTLSFNYYFLLFWRYAPAHAAFLLSMSKQFAVCLFFQSKLWRSFPHTIKSPARCSVPMLSDESLVLLLIPPRNSTQLCAAFSSMFWSCTPSGWALVYATRPQFPAHKLWYILLKAKQRSTVVNTGRCQ